MSLGTLCMFMIRAIKKKDQNSWPPIPPGCFSLLCLTETLDKPQSSGTPAALSPSNKRAMFMIFRVTWFTLHHKSVTRSLTQHFPIREALQKCRALSGLGLSTGRHSKKFPFYHKPMPPSFAVPEKQKGDSAICVLWCFIDDFADANRTKLLIFTFK